MKILYLVPSSGLGGAETFIKLTAKFHNRSTFQPVYVFMRKGPLFDYVNRIGHETYLYPNPPPKLRNLISVARFIFWLKKQIEVTHSDIVHSTMAYGALFGAPACAFTKVKHCWFQHGPVSGWMDWLAGILPSHTIISNSIHTQNEQLKLQKIKQHFEVILLGTDVEELPIISNEEIKTIRKNWGFTEFDFVIGMLARPQPHKGLLLFLEAIALLVQKHPTLAIKAVLVMASNNSQTLDYENKVRELACKIGPAVYISGPTEKPLQLMSAMDIVANGSITPEPFGLTLREAMALGKIPVAPNEGGPTEIITHYVNGLLYTPRNAQSLAQNLELLFLDHKLRDLLKKGALQASHEKFNARAMLKALENIYSMMS